MLLFNDQIIGDLLANDLETASIDLQTGIWSPTVPFFKGSSEGKFIKWHTFTNLEVLLILRLGLFFCFLRKDFNLFFSKVLSMTLSEFAATPLSLGAFPSMASTTM